MLVIIMLEQRVVGVVGLDAAGSRIRWLAQRRLGHVWGMQGVMLVSGLGCSPFRARWRLCRWPKPERRGGGLHRLIDHREQLG
jgi:hypothetical protein